MGNGTGGMRQDLQSGMQRSFIVSRVRTSACQVELLEIQRRQLLGAVASDARAREIDVLQRLARHNILSASNGGGM